MGFGRVFVHRYASGPWVRALVAGPAAAPPGLQGAETRVQCRGTLPEVSKTSSSLLCALAC